MMLLPASLRVTKSFFVLNMFNFYAAPYASKNRYKYFQASLTTGHQARLSLVSVG